MFLTAVSPSIEGLTFYFDYLEEKSQIEERDWTAKVKGEFKPAVIQAMAFSSGISEDEYIKKIADQQKAEAIVELETRSGVKDEKKTDREKVIDYYKEKYETLQQTIQNQLKTDE